MKRRKKSAFSVGYILGAGWNKKRKKRKTKKVRKSKARKSLDYVLGISTGKADRNYY
jgi:hypothetical protein